MPDKRGRVVRRVLHNPATLASCVISDCYAAATVDNCAACGARRSSLVLRLVARYPDVLRRWPLMRDWR